MVRDRGMLLAFFLAFGAAVTFECFLGL